MENRNHNFDSEHTDHFYKGLFFGLLLGVGAVWFFGSKTGKKFIQTLRKRIDEAFSAGFELEDYDEGEANPAPKVKTTRPIAPRRFFHKKEK